MLINNLVTVLASIFIGYYKIKEIIDSRRKNIYNQIGNGNDNGDDDEDGNKNKYYNNGSDNILILYEKMESINISV